MLSISIIIPVYSVAEYIAECIQSVMRQSYKGAIECIIVDDCSPDDSISVAEQLITKYKGPISFRLLRHDRNRGLSAARNTGMEVAKGDYIYFLDSDDYIPDDCIENLVSPLQKRDYEIVIGDYETFGDYQVPSLLFEKQDEIIGNENIFHEYAERLLPVIACNKLCRLSFLRENNINFLEGQLHEDDLWTYYIMLVIKSVAISHRITYYYRMRSNSITTDSSKVAKKAEALKVILQVVQSHPFHIAEDHNKCNCYYWGRYLQYAFESGVNFYPDYALLRSTCNYNPLKLFLHKKHTLSQLKKRLHFALPIKLGYRYLQLRNFKNKL